MANLSNINNKFLVTTGGNVGIGNTSPTLSTLAVGIGSTNSPSQICQLAGSGSGVYSVLSLTNTNGTAADNNGVGLDFHVNAAYSATGRIQLIHPTAQSGTTTNSSMQFLTYGTVSGVTTFSPRMTIDYIGNVGIGTTSPDAKLHIYGSSSLSEMYLGEDAAADKAGILKYTQGDGSGTGVITLSHWGNNSLTEGLAVKYGGNVGIGTTSPSEKLTLQLNTQNQAFSGKNGTDYLWFLRNEAGAGARQSGRFQLMDTDVTTVNIESASNRNTYFNAGNIGIGTTSPINGKFVINQNSSAASFGGNVCQLFENFNTTDGQMMSIGFRNNNSVGTTAYIDAVAYDQSIGATDIRFSTYSGSAWNDNMVTFQHTGRVGIGTTSPQSKLDLIQPDSSANTLGQSITASLGIRMANAIGQVGQIVFNNDAAPSYGYGSIGMIMTSGTGVGLGDMIFATKSTGSDSASTQRMRISSLGVVSVGTTSPITDPFISTNQFQQFQVGKSGVMGSYTNSAGEAMFANNIYVGSTYNTFQAIDPTLDGFGVFCYNTSIQFKFADTQANGTQNVSSKLTVDSASVIVNEGNLFLGATSSKTGTAYFWSNANDSRMSITNTGSTFELRATYLSSAGYKPIEFYTSDVKRLTIETDGRIQATRGNAGDLFVANSSSTAGSGIINYNSSLMQQSNNTSCSHFKGTTQNIASYHLYGNGSSSWSSDSRLKRDIKTTRDGYIDDINKLRVVKYKWKNDENSGLELGLIAQEVEKIFPSLVVDHKDAVGNGETYKSLKYSVLPTILLKGMQEQQKMIQELKAEIELLKSK